MDPSESPTENPSSVLSAVPTSLPTNIPSGLPSVVQKEEEELQKHHKKKKKSISPSINVINLIKTFIHSVEPAKLMVDNVNCPTKVEIKDVSNHIVINTVNIPNPDCVSEIFNMSSASPQTKNGSNHHQN